MRSRPWHTARAWPLLSATVLDRFFAVLRNQAELARCVSAQALSKARQHLPAAVFADLTQHLASLVQRHIGVPR